MIEDDVVAGTLVLETKDEGEDVAVELLTLVRVLAVEVEVDAELEVLELFVVADVLAVADPL